ncbi:MAG: prepilin peptidase [Planctomycetota bacterium]
MFVPRLLLAQDTSPASATLLTRSFDVVMAAWFFFFGSCLGSFLNVVVYRCPRKQSLLGVSRCPFCKNGIAPVDNIPIVGWLRLNGRCRDCGRTIAARYPAVEFAAGLFVMTLAILELGFQGANLSVKIPNVVPGFASNVFEPQLLGVLAWHGILGILLLGMALITEDDQPLPTGLLLTACVAIGGVATLAPSVLYAVRHTPIPPSWLVAWRDLAVGAIGGALIGYCCGWDDEPRPTYKRRMARNAAWLFGLAGAAFGWPLVVFCGVLVPLTSVIAQGLGSRLRFPLLLVAFVFFYLIAGYPISFPYLANMPF